MKGTCIFFALCTAACLSCSCAGDPGLCGRYQTETSINPSRVPKHLRDLVPLALKWGTGNPAVRDHMEKTITAEEASLLLNSLHGRTAAVRQWLETAQHTGRWAAESCAFRYLIEFYNDMNDVQLMKALKK